jgi:hypothetical protein
MDDDVLIEPHLVARTRLHGNSHPGISPDVPDLAVLGQVRRDEFIAIQPDPHDRHLRTTVGLEGHEVSQGGTFEHCARGLRNPGHRANVPPPPPSRSGRSRKRLSALASRAARCFGYAPPTIDVQTGDSVSRRRTEPRRHRATHAATIAVAASATGYVSLD